MIVLRVSHDVRAHFRSRMPEWFLGGEMLLAGLWLLRTGGTFASSPVYGAMARMASEDVWGLTMVALGTVRVLALLLNGTFAPFRRFSPAVRSTMSALGAFVCLPLVEWRSVPCGDGDGDVRGACVAGVEGVWPRCGD